MMTIGHIIRIERLNQKMKQSYLAKEICSPSYLSKIENNETIPSKEILDLLSKKLGISLGNNEKTLRDIANNKLQNIYEEVTVNRNINFIKDTLQDLIKNRFLYLEKEVYYSYNLLVIRLILSVNDGYETINSYLDPLLRDIERLSRYQYYLLKKFQGNYSYQIKMYANSVMFFEEAISISNNLPLKNWEKADLHYMYALSSLSESSNVNAIEYSKLALSYFLEIFDFKRVIECLIIQGIAEKNSKRFKEALKTYKKAEEICIKYNSIYYQALVAQNLGTLYARINKFDISISYYSKSLKLKTKIQDRLLSIYSIIQIYSKQNDEKKVAYWSEIGLSEIGENSQFQEYVYHFNLYKIFISENYYVDINYIEEAINFFESKKDYRHTYKYCVKIGEMLENINKYKKSSYFFKKAFFFNNKLLKNEYWEDI